MPEKGFIRRIRELFAGTFYQCLILSFCFLFGLAMIVNNQLAGEATWFWFATLFHHGAKLYADLHLALQPLYVLETDVWMNLFGKKVLVVETPSVFHLLVLCAGLFLVLRESDWPDWQKAIVIAASFVFWVSGYSYRFDDYHVTTESFILYSLLLLVLMAKTDLVARQIGLATALGVLCGLTATSRLNDGAALFGAVSICLLVLARKRKIMITGLFAAVCALTITAVIACTGDSFSNYLASTLTKALSGKGGAGSMPGRPFLLFINSIYMLHGYTWLFVAILVLAAAGALMQRHSLRDIVVGQLAITAVAFVASSRLQRLVLTPSALTDFATFSIVILTYLLAIVVLARLAAWLFSSGEREWDTREILILFPLAEMASNAVTAAAEPRSGYYAQMVLLLLLVPLLQLSRRQIAWANASFLTMLIWLGLTGAIGKERIPYYWDNMRGRPMFVDRQWYRHPVYGPMYIQTDALQFNTTICADIGGEESRAELLSLPFSYPNYFCDAPPWHGYVQTFLDITPRPTMDRLLAELRTAPPQWIVYQRQMDSMRILEQLFNHGRSMPQRELDQLIMDEIATNQWKLVALEHYQHGDGWYVIRTRP